MRRLGITFACFVLVGACDSATPSVVPSRGAPTISPSPTVSTPASPTAAACDPFDLARQSQASIVLYRASLPDKDVASGLDGTSVIGDVLFERGPWHQPAPQMALAVARDEPLLIRAFFDDLQRPLCLGSVTVDGAPFSPLGSAPEPSEIARLAQAAPNDGSLPTFPFPAPSARGEWVVRVSLTFATTPGPSRQDAFFRLRVDVAAPVVDGEASAPVACGEPGRLPPQAFLSVDGGPWVPSETGSFTWNLISGDGPLPVGPRVLASPNAEVQVRIADDLCAAWWWIQLAGRSAAPDLDQEPFVDLVPARTGYDPPGRANRFELAVVPSGDWVIAAGFEFGSAPESFIGQTTHAWNVVVP